MFYRPISSPFATLYVDLWSQGYMTDHNGHIALMNTMCNMNQFVVVVPVPNESSATLASHFMQHVLLIFGIYHLVVINDITPLRDLLLLCTQL